MRKCREKGGLFFFWQLQPIKHMGKRSKTHVICMAKLPYRRIDLVNVSPSGSGKCLPGPAVQGGPSVLEVNDIRENHKAITPTTNASKSRLQLTQREISPTHHTLILNGFSNSQKASITQHGPRTACAGCIESQNGGIFFAALQAKSAYKTGY